MTTACAALPPGLRSSADASLSSQRWELLVVVLLLLLLSLLSLPLSPLNDVWDLELVTALSVSGGVLSAAQLTLRFAAFFVIFAGIRLPAGDADPRIRVGADVAPVTDLPALLAHVEVLAVQDASHQHWPVLDVVWHFCAIE